MDPGHVGLIGGMAGTILGVAGGAYGTWREMHTEPKHPSRRHFSFWPSDTNPWEGPDWGIQIQVWVGLLFWIAALWAVVLGTEPEVSSLLLVLTFLNLWFGTQRQRDRMLDKVNRKLETGTSA